MKPGQILLDEPLYQCFVFIKAESRAPVWSMDTIISLLAYLGLLYKFEYKGNAFLSKIMHNSDLFIFCLFI